MRFATAAALLVLWSGAARAAPLHDLLAFYVPWDEKSLASLQKNARRIRVLAPAWAFTSGTDPRLTAWPDPAGRAVLATLRPKPKVWLLLQNARSGAWDGPGADALMADPEGAGRFLSALETEADEAGASGLVLDFEELASVRSKSFLSFLKKARATCRRRGWTLAVTAAGDASARDLRALSGAADKVVLMAYDEHWQTGPPGPISSTAWFRKGVSRALGVMPPRRLIVGLGDYAYDWPAGGSARSISIAEAEATAEAAGATPRRDAGSGESRFTYSVGGVAHEVWEMTAPSLLGEVRAGRELGVRSFALWRLGQEDPALFGPAPRR